MRLDYCNSLLDGLLARASRPLQLTQKAAARLVFTLPKSSHPTPLLRRWLPLAARISILITGTCLQCCDWLRPYLHPGHGQTLHPSPSTRPPSAKRLSTPSLLPPQLPLSLWSQSWLHVGGTNPPLTSGQQKLYTSSIADYGFLQFMGCNFTVW